MTLVKSLLLGSATALVAVAGAQAADLPARKAAPVEYVRVCAASGVGFFYIPGTDTCLRIGGRVRAEYHWAETFSRNHSAIGFRARGRLNIDARTPTPWGTLRTFFRFEMTQSTGTYNWANLDGPAFRNLARDNGGPLGGAAASGPNLDKAFIQWAGITAGQVQSFFDFYADNFNWSGLRGSDQGAARVLAYTATFGGGWSATLALEDRQQVEVTGPVGPGGAFIYGGQSLPDLIGVIRVDQGWGSAQLSAAVHQLREAGPRPLGPETDYGFAIQAGVKINLPMIAPGDELWLQAAYADGAINRLGFGDSFLSNRANAGHINTTHANAAFDALGNLHTTQGWAVNAAFLHYWTPTVRQVVFGSYASLDYDAAVTGPLFALVGGLGRNCVASLCDTKEWRLGSQVVWSPIRDFDIGLEVMYTRVNVSGGTFDVKDFILAAPVRRKTSDDALQVRLRFQRDF